MAEDGANEPADVGAGSGDAGEGSGGAGDRSPDTYDGPAAEGPQVDGPSVEVPSVEIPSVDVPVVDAPGVDGDDACDPADPADPAESIEAVDVGDSEIAALFVRHVLIWNAVLLALTLGALLITFRSDWTTGSRLIAIGIALSLYGAYRWPDPDGPDNGAGEDDESVDADESTG